jgi:NDP-sugar pyrophosphorylase family protein
MIRFATPQRAVILAAGFGSRLRPLTDFQPKPLVQVNGVSIMHNALRNLASLGVREVTIVVGYRKDAIEYVFAGEFCGMAIRYVESDAFERTGSAYSLWLARDALMAGDVYLLEGDVFFDEQTLLRLQRDEADNAAAVAPFNELMEGSAVVLDADGMIAEVRMKQTAADLSRAGAPRLFKTMNLLRLSGDVLRETVVPVLDELICSGAIKAYTEELLANLIEQRGMKLHATRCDDLKWYEIDSESDLRLAEEIFAPAQVHVGASRGRRSHNASISR